MITDQLFQMFSETSEIFVKTGCYLTRGESFHKEALSLCETDDDSPTLARLQAVLVLSLEYVKRISDGTSMSNRD